MEISARIDRTENAHILVLLDPASSPHWKLFDGEAGRYVDPAPAKHADRTNEPIRLAGQGLCLPRAAIIWQPDPGERTKTERGDAGKGMPNAIWLCEQRPEPERCMIAGKGRWYRE